MYAFVCPISIACILNLNRHQDSSSYRIINEQGSVSSTPAEEIIMHYSIMQPLMPIS